jgi:hypothetical protein
MLIIWRGLGILIPGIVTAFIGLTMFLCKARFGGDYWKQHSWPFGVALLASSVTCILLGRNFEGRRKRVEKEHKPGGFLPLRNDLFFINYLWWGLIIFVVSMLVLTGVAPMPHSAMAR